MWKWLNGTKRCLIESTCCVIFSKWGSAVRDPHSRLLKRTLIQQTYSGIWSCTLKKYARLFDDWFKTVCLVGLSKEMLWNSQDWVFSHQGQIFQTNVQENSFVAHLNMKKIHDKAQRVSTILKEKKKTSPPVSRGT